ncbi:MAG: hypothetical protein Ct9H300mP2_3350 [Candidatus Neomarinimicrobiota bacterium]|nr:MAG: hypothetical protein Ct9H300mP2_3350 [Candidatus Neomarinimicrobiota bacterium]
MNGLKHFRHRRQEVIVFHIMDRKELEFDFNNRTSSKIWRPEKRLRQSLAYRSITQN